MLRKRGVVFKLLLKREKWPVESFLKKENTNVALEQITYAFIDLRGPGQFGEAIRRFRKRRGLTQQQVADMAGCSLMYVSNLERGKATAELGKALRILDVLDVDVSLTDRRR